MQVAPEPAEVAEHFVDFSILDPFASGILLFLRDLRGAKNRELFRRRSITGRHFTGQVIRDGDKIVYAALPATSAFVESQEWTRAELFTL